MEITSFFSIWSLYDCSPSIDCLTIEIEFETLFKIFKIDFLKSEGDFQQQEGDQLEYISDLNHSYLVGWLPLQIWG